jgi:hypothetical protein
VRHDAGNLPAWQPHHCIERRASYPDGGRDRESHPGSLPLADAYHGDLGIPHEWREWLAMGGLIASLAERLFAPGTRDPFSDPRNDLEKSGFFA